MLFAEKDFNLPKHPEIDVPNLEVIKLRNASSVSGLTQKKGLGSLDSAMLQRGLQVYRDLGVLSREIAVSSIIGADLLPIKP